MNKIELFTRFLAENNIAARSGVLLSEKSTFRIGGPADLFLEPKNEEEISKTFTFAAGHEIPLLVLGNGSNVLFPDEGYRGAILHLGRGFEAIRQESETDLFCESGVKLSDLCAYAEKKGLSGLEFAYGIPGTAGGAIFMNAGAYGGEIKNVIRGARYLAANGSVKEIGAGEMNLEYRRSAFMDMNTVITGAVFRLTPGNPPEIRAKMDDYMSRRREKQPLEYPSAGSTFKRPPGNFASALIDQCGLKGLRAGGAAVSEKHAGFVINTGGAKCGDVLSLIDKIKDAVKQKTGYELECEVKIIG